MSERSKFGALIGSIDEGTSSARFILFKAESTEVVCFHQMSIEQKTPQEGWVEQNPMILLNTVIECIEKTIEKLISLGGKPEDVLAIGITNQRETTIVWDKLTGEPLHNAIVWLDMRTCSTVDQLLETVPNKTKNKNYLKPLCGLPLSPYFSAVKVKWLIDNVPKVKTAVKNNICLFGTVDTWLIWNLTGGVNGGKHLTDVTNASRTMLMNIETLKWDQMLCKFFKIPMSMLPEIRSSSEIYGEMFSGSLKNVKIAGCLGDQQAALVGQQCFKRGQAKATYGTGCFLLYNAGPIPVDSNHGLITTVAYQMGKNTPPIYALEGSVAIAGAALGWLKDNIKLLDNINDTEKIAETVENNGDVYFVPAFSGLYAPYWNQNARGIICGINEDTKRGHIIRATLEAVCFQVRDILDAMTKDCNTELLKLNVDGGMTNNKLLMQLQADLIGMNVLRPEMSETTALGAAIFAGHAIGMWNVNIELPLNYEVIKPLITENERDMRHSKWKMAIERSMGWDI